MNDVEMYISQFDPAVQERLKIIRQLFFEGLPATTETISYQIPAYKVGKRHLYFAAYKNHIGFYPVYELTELQQEMMVYKAKGTKASLHFPHNKPLPIDLIKKMIQLTALL